MGAKRKQPRRTKYNPLANPVRWAVMQPDHQAQLDETRIAELLALSALEAGKASDHDIRRIQFMVAMAEELGRIGIGPEAIPLCARILSASTPDIAQLRELFALHKQQGEAATAAQYLQAMHRL